MDEEAFWKACSKHIQHARDKHPHFADTVINRKHITPEASAASIARHTKAIISHEALSGRASVENILLGEVYEFIAELAKKDKARAVEEAADIVAVVYRAITDRIGGME